MDATEASGVAAETDGGGAGTAQPAGAGAPLASTGLRGRFFKGVAAEVVGFGSAQLLRLVSSLILTRILFPSAFGLMSMLGLVLISLAMLTDVGFTAAVIRSPRGDDPLFLDTVFTLKTTRALGIWLVASLLAWPISLLFREPALLYMIPVGSASVFIQGLHSMKVISLRRHMRVVPCVALDLATQAVTIVTSVSLAWAGLGVWSLVIANLVSASFFSITTYFLPGTGAPRERFRIDPAARKEIIRFGGWVFASSAVTLVANRSDQAVLGRMLGAASLGVYGIALNLAEVPEALVGRLIEGMVYPLFSRVFNERPHDLPRIYYRTRLLLDGVVHTGLGGLIALAPWLIHLLYDQRYQGAAVMLQIVCFRTALTVLASPCENVLFSSGHSVYAFARNISIAAANPVLMILGYVIGTRYPEAVGGPVGLLWGTVAARAMAFLPLWPAAYKRGLFRLHRELLFIPLLASGYGLGRLVLLVLPWRAIHH